MAFVKQLAHLSRLAFFVSLGVAATIVDACGGREDNTGDPEPPKGGGTSTGQAGAASGGLASGGSNATGGNTGIVIDAGAPPKDADLWDVICE